MIITQLKGHEFEWEKEGQDEVEAEVWRAERKW